MASENAATKLPAPHLGHHFDSLTQQFEAGKLGMWLFLVTEILLFGGLFCAYAVYRSNHPEIFVYAHQYLDTNLGALNTVVLICSSLTMAWGVRCAQLGRRRGLIVCLSLTLLCAGGFLGVKGVEYSHKWKEGLLWGARFDPQEGHGDGGTANELPGEGDLSVVKHPDSAEAVGAGAEEEPVADTGKTEEKSKVAPAAVGPAGLAAVPEPGAEREHGVLERPSNVHLFFGIYFTMTGLHGLHVLAGMAVITWVLIRAFGGDFGPENYLAVDLTGLYWHVVDLIWIYLFPLLYLIH